MWTAQYEQLKWARQCGQHNVNS